MAIKKSGKGLGSRLETGAVILAAAELVDTNLVKPRLTRFTNTHRTYTGAQRKVEALEAQLRDIQAQLVRVDAAQAAEQAARAMEAALAPTDKLDAALVAARRKRDAVGERWDAALAALKHGARFAADEGAPGLYNALFGRLGRPSRKNGKAAPTPAPTAQPAAPA